MFENMILLCSNDLFLWKNVIPLSFEPFRSTKVNRNLKLRNIDENYDLFFGPHPFIEILNFFANNGFFCQQLPLFQADIYRVKAIWNDDKPVHNKM